MKNDNSVKCKTSYLAARSQSNDSAYSIKSYKVQLFQR